MVVCYHRPRRSRVEVNRSEAGRERLLALAHLVGKLRDLRAHYPKLLIIRLSPEEHFDRVCTGHVIQNRIELLERVMHPLLRGCPVWLRDLDIRPRSARDPDAEVGLALPVTHRDHWLELDLSGRLGKEQAGCRQLRPCT